MSANRLRQLFASGGAAVNGWLAVPSVFSAEIMGRAGWDAITIDMQHGAVDYGDALAMLTAITAGGQAAPMVRVPWNEPGAIMRMLDAGALGIICPMIESAEAARAFVRACCYPPKGARSFGPIRARLIYGDGYATDANDNVMPFAMIETAEALARVEEILDVEGLAGVYIGPADLAYSLGETPRFDPVAPRVVAAVDRILAAAKARGLVAGIHNGTPEYARAMIEKGFQLVTVGSDARFIEAGAKATLAAMKG